MDVPTRQAYVMALVEPDERTPAAAYTNTARYLIRPVGAVCAGAAQSIWLGAPLVIAGTIKSIYDVALWRWFPHVAIPDDDLAGGYVNLPALAAALAPIDDVEEEPS